MQFHNDDVDGPADLDDSMEYLGYRIIKCRAHPAQRLQVVENTFRYQHKEKRGPTTHCRGIQECERFLQDGLDEKISTIVEQELKIPYQNVYVSSSIVLSHNPEYSPTSSLEESIKAAYPSSSALTLIRVAKGKVQDKNGFLKLYPTSHHLMVEDFIRSPTAATQPALCPDDLLIMYGTLKWEIVPPPDCLLVMKSFSKTKMLLNALSPYTLPCMTFTTYQAITRPSLVTSTGKLQARDLLQGVLDSMTDLGEFFKQRDYSSMVLKFRPQSISDIWIHCIHPKEEDRWQAHQLRIIAAKVLVSKERLWMSQHGADFERNGLGAEFLRSQGLDNSKPTRDFLEEGHKQERIERQVGVPGIWLMWIPVLPLFRRLYRDQENELIALLKDEPYSAIIAQGKNRTLETGEYEDLFEKILDHFSRLECQ